MTFPDAVDFVNAPDVGLLVQLGIVPWPYSGAFRPAQAWWDACRAAGIDPPVSIFETTSERSQVGENGAVDVVWHEGRNRDVAFRGANAVVVSDGNSADVWDAGPYGFNWGAGATEPFFPYGAKGVTATFIAGALQSPGAHLLVLGVDGTPGDWVPETWGNGTIARQVVGPSPIPSTDLDHVLVDLSTGAAATTGADEMLIGLRARNDPASPNAYDAELIDGGVSLRRFSGPYVAWGFVITQRDAVDFAAMAGIHPAVFTPAEWAAIDARTRASVVTPGTGDSGASPEQIAAVHTYAKTVTQATAQLVAAFPSTSA